MTEGLHFSAHTSTHSIIHTYINKHTWSLCLHKPAHLIYTDSYRQICMQHIQVNTRVPTCTQTHTYFIHQTCLCRREQTAMSRWVLTKMHHDATEHKREGGTPQHPDNPITASQTWRDLHRSPNAGKQKGTGAQRPTPQKPRVQTCAPYAGGVRILTATTVERRHWLGIRSSFRLCMNNSHTVFRDSGQRLTCRRKPLLLKALWLCSFQTINFFLLQSQLIQWNEKV